MYPRINHQLLFDLKNDPHELKNLATDAAYQPELSRMHRLMGSWRDKLNDPSPLSVENPDPLKPVYDNDKRVEDRWQPNWIRKKYFGGSTPRK